MAIQILNNCHFDSTKIIKMWVGSRLIDGNPINYPIEYTTISGSSDSIIRLENWDYNTNVITLGGQQIQLNEITNTGDNLSFSEDLVINQNGKTYVKNIGFTIPKLTTFLINQIKEFVTTVSGKVGLAPTIALLIDENDQKLIVGHDNALYLSTTDLNLGEGNEISLSYQSTSYSRARAWEIDTTAPVPIPVCNLTCDVVIVQEYNYFVSYYQVVNGNLPITINYKDEDGNIIDSINITNYVYSYTILPINFNKAVNKFTVEFIDSVCTKSFNFDMTVEYSQFMTLSGLTAWYGNEVNNGIERVDLASGATITRWDDMSGNNYDLASKTGTVVKLANNSIDFNNGMLYNTTYPITTGSTARTVFVVYEKGDVLVQTYPLIIGKADAAATMFAPFHINATAFYVDCNAKYRTYTIPTTYSNTKYLASIKLTGTTVSTISDVRFNNNVLTPQLLADATLNTYTGISMGGYLIGNTPTLTGDAHNFEVLIYNRALSSFEIGEVAAYLNLKYSIY